VDGGVVLVLVFVVQSEGALRVVGEVAFAALEVPAGGRQSLNHHSAVLQPTGVVLPPEVEEEGGVAGVVFEAYLTLLGAVAGLVWPPARLAVVQHVVLARFVVLLLYPLPSLVLLRGVVL